MGIPKSPSSPLIMRSDKPIEAPRESLPLLARKAMYKATPREPEFSRPNYDQELELSDIPGPDFREQLRRKSISVLEMNRHQQHNHGNNPYGQASRPFFERLLSHRATVLNANSSVHDLNQGLTWDADSVHSLDLEENYNEPDPSQRISFLSVLRPAKLIGNYRTVANWEDRLVDVSKIRNRKLRKFYEDQNELIERYIEIDHLLDYGRIHLNMLSTYTNSNSKKALLEESVDPNSVPLSLDMAESNSKSRLNDAPGNIHEGGQYLGYNLELALREVYVAIVVNFFINFLLLVGKVFIAFLTDSLSIVASLVDSLLDFLSTFIIYIANRLSTTNDWQVRLAYPIGRAKLEPLGILIFSVIIIISFFQVGLESFKKLFLSKPEDRVVVEIGLDAISIMVVTILAKVGCWLWCKASSSSSVQALAQDAMTDIVFNTVSLIMPAVGHFAGVWWLDPAGAFLLSFYVIISWSSTAYEHIDNLTGAVADAMDYKIILYLAYRFAECIKLVTALKVYHTGDLLNVEIDLVFNTEDFDLSFKDAHDIAEALQYAIETLPMVERAYVHIDYMEGNFKGHLT